MQGIPPPLDSDAEDVVWALQTADTLWKRGERTDAVVWLRRAAGAAGEAQDDDRAIELARLAGELTELDQPPPPAAALTPPPPPPAPVVAAPPAPASAVDVEIDVELGDSVRNLASLVPAPVPQPATVVPRPAISSAPKAASTPPRASSRPPRASDQPAAAPFFPPPARTPAEAAPQRSAPPPVPAGLPPMRERAPSAAEAHAGMYDPWAEGARPSERQAVPASANAEPPSAVPSTARSAGASPAPSVPPPQSGDGDVLTSAIPSVTPSRAALLDAAASEYEAEELSEAELVAASLPPPALASAPTPPKAPPLKKPPPLPPRARTASVIAAEESPAKVEAEAAPAAEAPSAAATNEAVVPPSLESDERGLSGLLDLPEESPADDAPPGSESAANPGAPLDLASALEAAPGLSDLPDDDRAAFCAAATVHSLNKDENLAQFALALVLGGEVDVTAAIVDAPAARLGKQAILRSRGTTDENVAIRLIAASEKAHVATWTQEHVDKAFASCPWVEEDLRAAADRVLTLVGVTMGPLGERLDAALRDQVTGRLNIRSLLPGEVVVTKGSPVPGIIVIGVGELELVDGDKVQRTLASGEFLFPEAILGAAKAPADARAGTGGALVMVGDRMLAQELLVTCPPLLEIFAGM